MGYLVGGLMKALGVPSDVSLVAVSFAISVAMLVVVTVWGMSQGMNQRRARTLSGFALTPDLNSGLTSGHFPTELGFRSGSGLEVVGVARSLTDLALLG